jgi:AcrR family transcriptional regulator
MSITRLQRELADGPRDRRPTPLDAFKLARRRFQAAQRVDMSALADELQINRVTLYRWVGSREQLLVEVLWSLTTRNLELVRSEVHDTGAERVVQVVTRWLENVIDNRGMQRLLSEEGELALRLLTLRDSGFQPRLIAAFEELLREEADAGRLDVPADLHDVAYVIVRLVESFTHVELILGERPDARRAEPILRMLLR